MKNTIGRIGYRAAIAAVLLMPFSQSHAVGKTALVALSGGDYSNPNDAMADLSTWCGTPSSSNRCLLKLAAGTFELNSTPLDLQPWVSLRGTGEGVTVLVASSAGHTLRGADNSTISDLTVDTGTDSSTYAVGIYNNQTSPTIRRTTVIARAPGTHNTFAIHNVDSQAIMENITINHNTNSWNTAVRNQGGATTLRNAVIKVTGPGVNIAIENDGGTTPHRIFNSSIVVSGGTSNEGIRISNGRTYGYKTSIDASGGGSAIGINQVSNNSSHWLRFHHMAILAYSATAAYAMKVPGGYNGANINNSYLYGATASVYQGPGAFTMRLHHTRLHSNQPILRVGSPTIHCTAVTAGNHDFYGDSCP